MKKKTSLWISGITTVAMLAVAVGSFAAWDTLTANDIALSAQSSTPVTLAVDQDVAFKASFNFASPNTLVPEGAIEGTNDKSELISGFKVVLTQASDKGAKAYLEEPTLANTTEDIDFEIIDMGENGTTEADALTFKTLSFGSDSKKVAELTSGHQYKVSVKFNKTADNLNGSTYSSAKNLSTTLTCFASKEGTQPTP